MNTSYGEYLRRINGWYPPTLGNTRMDMWFHGFMSIVAFVAFVVFQYAIINVMIYNPPEYKYLFGCFAMSINSVFAYWSVSGFKKWLEARRKIKIIICQMVLES